LYVERRIEKALRYAGSGLIFNSGDIERIYSRLRNCGVAIKNADVILAGCAVDHVFIELDDGREIIWPKFGESIWRGS